LSIFYYYYNRQIINAMKLKGAFGNHIKDVRPNDNGSGRE